MRHAYTIAVQRRPAMWMMHAIQREAADALRAERLHRAVLTQNRPRRIVTHPL